MMGFDLLTLLLILLSCANYSQSQACDSSTIASYRVTFEGFWTKNRFPKVYPESRPKAEWSSLIGRSHSSAYKLFTKGELVSEQLQWFVEYGDTTKLSNEGQGHSVILDSFTSPPLEHGSGITETMLFADGTRHKVSLAVKIVPSPDWFVGIDSYSLCRDGKWVDSEWFNLRPLDAGSQRGYTFSSPRWSSDPQEVISEIRSSYPNHTADAFYYPHLTSLPPIAKVQFQLLQLFKAQEKSPANPLQSPMNSPPEKPAMYQPSGSMYADELKEGRTGGIIKPPLPHFPRNISPTLSSIVWPTILGRGRTTPSPSTTMRSYTSMTSERMTSPEHTTEATYNSIGSTQGSTTSAVLNEKILALLEQMRKAKNSKAPAAFTRTPAVFARTPATSSSDSVSTAAGVTTATGYTTSNVSPAGALHQQTTPDTASTHDKETGIEVERVTTDRSTEFTGAVESNKILPPDYDYDGEVEKRVCIVSEWTAWTNCSRICGYGVKTRTRTVLEWTENISCPELKVEQLCGSMRKCNWNHFSFKFNSTKSVLMQKGKRIRKKPNLPAGANADMETAGLTGDNGVRKFRKVLAEQP